MDLPNRLLGTGETPNGERRSGFFAPKNVSIVQDGGGFAGASSVRSRRGYLVGSWRLIHMHRQKQSFGFGKLCRFFRILQLRRPMKGKPAWQAHGGRTALRRSPMDRQGLAEFRKYSNLRFLIWQIPTKIRSGLQSGQACGCRGNQSANRAPMLFWTIHFHPPVESDRRNPLP